MDEAARETARYDSRKYRLANHCLIAGSIAFAVSFAALWQGKQYAAIPSLLTGYATLLIGVLTGYGLTNAAAKYANGAAATTVPAAMLPGAVLPGAARPGGPMP